MADDKLQQEALFPDEEGDSSLDSMGESELDFEAAPPEGGEQGLAARFEGVKLRVRKASAGRYALGVEVELALDQPLRGDKQAHPEAEEEAEEPGEEDVGETSAERPPRALQPPAPSPASPTAKAMMPVAMARSVAKKPVVKVADVQPDKKNPSVLIVQKALAKAVGLDYSSAPGKFGPRTKKAYAAWQRKCGFSGSAADGKPGPKSLKLLGDKYGFTVQAGGGGKPASKGRMPGATWRPLTDNYRPGGQKEVRGLVIHIMEGYLEGTDAEFRKPGSDASSHFGTDREGKLVQWVNTKDMAFTQRAGNPYWLSVENAGFASKGDRLTPQQIKRCAQILAWAHKVYGVPLQVANSPSGRGLGHHSMGKDWGHQACPGPRIIAQKPAIVALAKKIVSGQATRRAVSPQARPRPVARAQEHTEAFAG